jgi:dTDP-4-amino-4,6-dideoxygalactose transaminase
VSSSAPDIPLVDLSWQHAQIQDEVAEGFARVLESGAYVLGPEVEKFELDYADFCGGGECVGVANGTDALELSLRAVGVGQGDEVILPANTFVATAGAVMRSGATPVLVDCDDKYLLIDPAQIEQAVTRRTRAIVPVHLYGQVAPMEDVIEAAAAHGLRVIEDAAQSQGARRNGRRSGSFGDAAATSFYPGKNLGAYGDGGAVTSGSAEIARRLRQLRNHGSVAKYQHPVFGINSRLDGLQAVVLRAKLTRLDEWNAMRNDAAERYAALLAGIPAITLPETLPGNDHAWHLYVVRVPDRDRVLASLNAAGVGAGIHYPSPVHLLGAYDWMDRRLGDFPVAEQAANEILSLPMYPGITSEQQERVVATLADALGLSWSP